MLTAVGTNDSTGTELLEELAENFSRNLIGGHWHFPAAPYEYEIRSPLDSRVIAVVPLSSRFDVAAAVSAARVPLDGPWSDPAERADALRRLLDHLERRQLAIARLQSEESGLGVADSLCAVQVTLRQLRAELADGVVVAVPAGVSGHILSWGAPFLDALTSIWPSLVRGRTVVVKPSLRAPLSAAFLGLLAGQSGIPAGVVNVVQGTGTDVGAELIRRPDLAALHVRAGERTTASARRARTGVALHTVRSGGNVCVVGPEPVDVGRVADHVAAMVRMNSAGGVFGLPLLAVHPEVAEPLLAAVVDRLDGSAAAPLPSDAVRGRAVARIAALADAGAAIRRGGAEIPDDIEHRMGWRIPATVLELGGPDSAASALQRESVPFGPVLSVVTVADFSRLGAVLPARCEDGFAWVWGVRPDRMPELPHATVVTGPVPGDLADALTIPPAWTGSPE